ncbi:uncharacterized protein LOC141612996 [Silene latifolia]|uniref:uncharacterized protein LOC141612996 n=1 Tax=Silene latifolia TaxID=37657 RepID=UPI003D78B04E
MEEKQKQKILGNELVRKRKSSSTQMIDTTSYKKTLLGFDVDLNLSLSSTSNPMPVTPQPPLPEIQQASGPSRRGRRITKSEGSRGSRPPLKTDPIAPPFVWATDKRATIHSMEYLVSQGITTITGGVQCKKCEKNFVMEYNLREKFNELVMFIVSEDGMTGMSDRAPKRWMKPVLPTCKFCGEPKSCKPLIAEKKRNINWLFLLLGELLGCCTLEQLKYFCKYNLNHRTGAKDRVLLLSYFTLCKQLDPNGPFHF